MLFTVDSLRSPSSVTGLKVAPTSTYLVLTSARFPLLRHQIHQLAPRTYVGRGHQREDWASFSGHSQQE